MRTVVSIYILIPLILVPQLLLGGAMIKFDDLHKSITRKEYVPVVGDLMATRWAYEAIMVEGYKSNRYRKPTFDNDLEINQNDYYKDVLIKNLKDNVINYILQKDTIPSEKKNLLTRFRILNYHINELSNVSGIPPGNWIKKLNYKSYRENLLDSVNTYFDKLYLYFIARNSYYRKVAEVEKTNFLRKIGKTNILRDAYDNQRLVDLVLNQLDLKEAPYYEKKNKWVQKTTPIYMKPTSRYGRAQFYAPYKQIGNLQIGTLLFNTIAMWFMIGIFFWCLYADLLGRFIKYLESLKLPFWRKFGRQSL
jgi:hypothetical protein